MKKFFVVIILLLIMSSYAFGASLTLPVRHIRNRDTSSLFDELLVERLERLDIEFIGAYVYNYDGNIDVIFKVTSNIDTTLNASADLLFDNKGGKFLANDIRMAGYPVSKHEVIAKTPIIVLFEFPSVYERKLRAKDLRSIASAKFKFNDQELEFRDVPLQTWGACLQKMEKSGFSKREWFER